MLDYSNSRYNSGRKIIIKDNVMTEYQHRRGSIDILVVRYLILDNGFLGIEYIHKISCLDEEDAYREFGKIRICEVGTTVNYYLWKLGNNTSPVLNSPYPTTTACMMLAGSMNEEKKIAIQKFLTNHKLEFNPEQVF